MHLHNYRNVLQLNVTNNWSKDIMTNKNISIALRFIVSDSIIKCTTHTD